VRPDGPLRREIVLRPIAAARARCVVIEERQVTSMTTDKQNPPQRARGTSARERAHDLDHPASAVGGRRWARRDAERIRMDIGDDFFKRHAHLIASTTTFRSADASAATMGRGVRAGAEVANDARLQRDPSDGVPTDELPRRGSGRA